MANKVEDSTEKQPKRVSFKLDETDNENEKKNFFKKSIEKIFKKKEKKPMVGILKLVNIFLIAKNLS